MLMAVVITTTEAYLALVAGHKCVKIHENISNVLLQSTASVAVEQIDLGMRQLLN